MTPSPHQPTTPFDPDDQPFDSWAERFRLLSEPSRLRILSVICQGERNVSDICTLTGLHQANVSKHLQLLKVAGVVACRRVGICRYYRIVDDEVRSLCPSALMNGER